MTDNKVAAQIRRVADQLEARVDLLRALADELDGLAGGTPPFEDISESLPVNHQPDHPYLVARGWEWWPERDLSEIAGITVHQTISIGLAGRLHLARPPQEQLEAAARLICWLMDQYGIPLDEIRGHCERYAGTICPGWNQTGWRNDLFVLITP